MGLYRYLNRIRRLDALIRQKRTGPPKELAEKLGISERWLYIFMDELKTDLDCPIRYDRMKRSYVYEEPGEVIIGFRRKISNKEVRNVNGGRTSKNIFPVFIGADCKFIFNYNINLK